ncbi:MAG: 4Fe-4S binding protein [Planctomycetota bacterium]
MSFRHVLRSLAVRRVARLALLFVAAVLIWHGLRGPQLAPRNLSTLLVWVHWRGLLVAGLLVIGNVFCYACPFMLVRDAARRFLRPAFTWPAALRTKWLAIGLLVALLFAYELFDLWASPWVTAWLVIGYFAAAVLVDTLFRGGSFCKWVCPIGQFNFVASTASPTEVQVRDPAVCTSCTTHDCISGRPGQPELRGCELGLFLPRKVGNLDCTYCMDCVRACPHDNVTLAVRLPAAELWATGSRSGVGEPERQAHFSWLAIVFVFGALLNAFGMVSPVYALQSWMAGRLGLNSEAAVLGLLFAIALVVEPVVLLGLCAAASRRWGRLDSSWSATLLRFAWGLVPLGFGVWLAHYGFHLLTGLFTVVPVAQKTVLDTFGAAWLGQPAWGLGGLRAESVDPIETGLLLLGFFLSLGVCWRIAADLAPARTVRAFLPWAALLAALLAAALWLMAQPMEMRGTFLGGG